MVTFIHLGLIAMNRSISNKTVVSIEWDMEEEVFVIKKPKTTFGTNKELKIHSKDFTMVKDDKDSLYQDAKTGERF